MYILFSVKWVIFVHGKLFFIPCIPDNSEEVTSNISKKIITIWIEET